MSEAFRQQTRNCILARDEVGRAKTSSYDLPPAHHAYGKSKGRDREGAREVIAEWVPHAPREKAEDGLQDFIKINRSATKNAVANARQLKDYRKGIDFKYTPGSPRGPHSARTVPSDADASFAYGQKGRPSTPIANVVGGSYAVQSEEFLEAQYRRYADESDMPNGKHRIKLTKAQKKAIAEARRKHNVPEPPRPPEPFKLSKFKKVSPRLQLQPIAKEAEPQLPHTAR
mmetsp:Transcript_91212/g.162450  ORF Transcript_91212/g.162450 Transcript_91212/m.162450 type:complete len:229 (+) Transcript_91212:72-758(+)